MNKADYMIALIEACRHETQAMLPANEFAMLSIKTRREYRQIGKMVLNRARYAVGGVAEVLTDTQRPTTFYKRLAALRYCLYDNHVEYLGHLHEVLSTCPVDRLQIAAIHAQLQQHRVWLREFEEARQNGHTGERRKRTSKRQALRGLPDDWREQLYVRAAKGKYAEAILIAALTGCRPEELRRGVIIRRECDSEDNSDYFRFQIRGAKVRSRQGQPSRSICYLATDTHPLVVALQGRLAGQRESLIRIDSPANFTVEVRRLAGSLWPKHKLAITAYCLRHQWAADMKRHRPADSVSQGLGHISAKTRRHYGQANQASGSYALHPIAIEAERLVKQNFAIPPSQQAESGDDANPNADC